MAVKKANGAGSIFLDSARGKYRAMLIDDAGKRVTKRFSTKAEAQEWLTTTQADIFRGNYMQNSQQSLGEWVLEYINTYKRHSVRPSTLARYYDTMKYIEPISKYKLKELTSLTVQRFYNNLPSNLSASSNKKIQNLLQAAIKKAVALGAMKDILLPVERPKIGKSKKQIEIFRIEEIRDLLKNLQNDKYYNRYYLFVKLAVMTGARLGELLALRTSRVHDGCIQIDFNGHAVGGKMIFNEPKTAAGNRKITISTELSRQLKDLGASREFVFHSDNAEYWNTHTIEHSWKRIIKKYGLEYKSFHCLRHTHATQLLGNNVPVLEVSKRLGHSKASTTLNLYGHAIPGYDQTLPEKVQNIFNV